MFKKLFLAGLIAFSLSTGICYGRGDSIAYKPIEDLTELAATPTADTDFIPAFDASANQDVKLDVDRFLFQDPTTSGITVQGPATIGVGTKSSGWVIADSSETTTGNSQEGTVATFAVPASSTAYLVADVVSRAPTGTAWLAYTVSGTFDRNGTASMTNNGTATIDSDTSPSLVDSYVRWATTGDGNIAQLNVKGTNTKHQWIATVKSLTVTTTGAE